LFFLALMYGVITAWYFVQQQQALQANQSS
jgi:hypothetical protein